ncbi:MAG: hypothetical protein A3G75_03040 [Verrucomicrobia bacterium RIFCSPLOWO2_12_FULL_64_8]|nr:MAG: hypothetical protein A3G75_03040 [Verrucomicrobia bacterium RIFCSPLOWO2_12_FULL_64_8]
MPARHPGAHAKTALCRPARTGHCAGGKSLCGLAATGDDRRPVDSTMIPRFIREADIDAMKKKLLAP